VEGGAVVFDSDTFGINAQVVSENGRLCIKNGQPKIYDLLGEKAYTSGLKAEAEIGYDAGQFQIMLTVKQVQLLPDGLKTELTVRALNANTP